MRKGYKAKKQVERRNSPAAPCGSLADCHAAAGMGRRSVTGCKADGGRHRVMEERFGR